MTTTSEAKDSFVYVIGHDGSNVVKIGKADNVSDRLASIQRMSPVALRVLAQFDGGYRLETALHRRFKHLRTHGEWFDFRDADPVAEITKASKEINDDWDAEDGAAFLAEWEVKSTAAVFLIDGRLRYMPAVDDGGWRCLGRGNIGERRHIRRDGRCLILSDVRQCEELTAGSWTVPGLGFVTGWDLDAGAEEIRQRALSQLCRRHFENTSEEAAEPWVILKPSWQLFDPARHAQMIEPFGRSSTVPLAPGFEGLEEKVRVYVQWRLAQ